MARLSPTIAVSPEIETDRPKARLLVVSLAVNTWTVWGEASLSKRLPFLVRFYVTRGILLLGYVLTRDWERARAILQGMGKG